MARRPRARASGALRRGADRRAEATAGGSALFFAGAAGRARRGRRAAGHLGRHAAPARAQPRHRRSGDDAARSARGLSLPDRAARPAARAWRPPVDSSASRVRATGWCSRSPACTPSRAYLEHMLVHHDDADRMSDILAFCADFPLEYLASRLGVTGPRVRVDSACASGSDALAVAAEWLELGVVDDVIVVAASSMIDPVGLTLFRNLRALSDEDDVAASRPFDRRRRGFVMGEGAAAAWLSSRLPRSPLGFLCGHGRSMNAEAFTAMPTDLDAMAAACLDALGPGPLRRLRLRARHRHADRRSLRDAPLQAGVRRRRLPHPDQLDQVDDGALPRHLVDDRGAGHARRAARADRAADAEPRRARSRVRPRLRAAGAARRSTTASRCRWRSRSAATTRRCCSRARSRGEHRLEGGRDARSVSPPAAPSSPATCRPSSPLPRAPDASRCAHRIAPRRRARATPSRPSPRWPPTSAMPRSSPSPARPARRSTSSKPAASPPTARW